MFTPFVVCFGIGLYFVIVPFIFKKTNSALIEAIMIGIGCAFIAVSVGLALSILKFGHI